MSFFNRAGMQGKKSSFHYRDSGILELRSGGGCLSVFGLPFLLAGLFILQVPLGIIPVEYDRNSSWMPFVCLIIGGVFTAVGAGLVFGRGGIILDRGMGRITRWYGLLVPMKRTEYLLDGIHRVELDFSRGDSDSADTWPVSLSGEGIPKPIVIMQPVSLTEARQAAEELSRFLRKPLVDSSTGERVTRDFEHLDESYRDRALRTGEAAATVPPEPPGMRSRVERTGEGYVFHIPGPPTRWFHYVPVFFPVALAGAVAYFFLPAILTLPMPDFIRYFFLGFIGLFFIAGPVVSALLRLLRLKNQFERIIVTKALLRVEALKQGKSTAVEIPVNELEDLVSPTVRSVMDTIEVPGMKKVPLGNTGTPRMPDGRPVPRFLLSLMKMTGSKGIVARSDKTVVEFASGLDEAETVYLCALIRKVIVGV